MPDESRIMSDLLEEARPTADEAPQRAVDPSARAAALVFAAALLAGFIFYVVEARNVWFFRDDWEFLAGRGFNLHDLLRQHGGHFVALPLATYRLMFFVVGLRSYLPYQLLTIGLQLTAASLLRVIMRRARESLDCNCRGRLVHLLRYRQPGHPLGISDRVFRARSSWGSYSCCSQTTTVRSTGGTGLASPPDWPR